MKNLFFVILDKSLISTNRYFSAIIGRIWFCYCTKYDIVVEIPIKEEQEENVTMTMYMFIFPRHAIGIGSI